MVMEFYDIMVLIWGGAPSSEPLSFCAHSAGQADESQEQGVDISGNSGLGNEKNEYDSDESLTISLGNNVVSINSASNEATIRKRPASNQVPILIDNKRQHKERQLSAAQKDKLLMQEGQKEKKFRCDLLRSLKESNNIFAESVKAMSDSMMALASSMQRSIEHVMIAFTAARLFFGLVFTLGTTTSSTASGPCGKSHLYAPATLKSPLYPSLYPNSIDCNWTISGTNGSRVSLTFRSFSLESDSRCRYDYLDVYDGDSSYASKLGRYCGNQLPRSLTSSGIHLFIAFHSDGPCGISHLYAPATLKSPLYPSLYPNSIDCNWTISGTNGSRVSLTFRSFSLESDSRCRYDYLDVYDGDSSYASKLGRYCGNQLPQSLTSSGVHLLIAFHSDGSQQGKGFVLDFSNKFGPCGISHLYAPATLKSPLYPSLYPNSIDCNWTISGTNGSRVSLTFRSFSLESDSRCRYDYLDVYDGDSSYASKLGRYCGNQLPQSLTSSGVHLFIAFHSDGSQQGKGFVLDFSNKFGPCGISHLYAPATLKSPLYPSLYPNSIDCNWTISGTNGSMVSLTFRSFSLESDSRCRYDYLDVYDGDSSYASKLGRYCGNQLPRSLTSSGVHLFIAFHSDGSQQGKGFVLDFSNKFGPCGISHLYAPATLKSPLYPSLYPNSIDCNWTISGTNGSRVSLTFRSFSLGSDSRCRYDYLDVYDGDSSYASKLGRYCGNQLPQSLTSSGVHLFIAFHSDGSQQGKGFVLDFSNKFGPCGISHLYAPATLKSPLYPSLYPNSIDCNWTISGTNGSRVSLTFRSFSLESDSRCRYDYLDVYDGDSSYASKLGRYCGNQLPQSLTSSGVHLFIAFHSDGSQQRKGFVLDFSNKFGPCGISHLYAPATLKSPLYPSLYPNSIDCNWTISGTNGSRVSLTFRSFSLESDSRCRYDYLDVYDGDSSYASKLGRYCGNQLPQSLTSSGVHLFIAFHSDGSQRRKGFVFWISKVN
ncbi:cubilin-like [Dendronephthya gigantea]|uniref:cubilin-like n=1 Tax=Dendronephthya gigantea TaxID=151771 RepID=UPI00106D2F93|nr:cubilin-like [Dendronephthya gigantea]